MASARQYFPKNKQTTSCWAAELFTVFYSTHEMWVNFLRHLSKKPQKTRKSNHARLCLRSHLGAVEEYGVTSPGIDPGSRRFLGKFGKIHREPSPPLGIPFLFGNTFAVAGKTLYSREFLLCKQKDGHKKREWRIRSKTACPEHYRDFCGDCRTL